MVGSSAGRSVQVWRERAAVSHAYQLIERAADRLWNAQGVCWKVPRLVLITIVTRRVMLRRISFWLMQLKCDLFAFLLLGACFKKIANYLVNSSNVF